MCTAVPSTSTYTFALADRPLGATTETQVMPPPTPSMRPAASTLAMDSSAETHCRRVSDASAL